MVLHRLFQIVLIVVCTISPMSAQEGEEEESRWGVSASARYLSKFTNYGVDLSQDQPALSFSSGISHISGLSFELNPVVVLGSNGGYQQSSFEFAYERSLGSLASISADFTHYAYKSDTVNALAGLSNSISVGVDFDLDPTSISVSYSRFLGGEGASYVVLGASTYLTLKNLLLVPVAQLSIVSQTVPAIFLKTNKGKVKTQITSLNETVTGLSSFTLVIVFSYPILEGLKATLVPSFVYSPTELAARDAQLVWSAGITYSIDF